MASYIGVVGLHLLLSDREDCWLTSATRRMVEPARNAVGCMRSTAEPRIDKNGSAQTASAFDLQRTAGKIGLRYCDSFRGCQLTGSFDLSERALAVSQPAPFELCARTDIVPAREDTLTVATACEL